MLGKRFQCQLCHVVHKKYFTIHVRLKISLSAMYILHVVKKTYVFII